MQGVPIQLGIGAQLPLFNQGPSMEARTPINEALLTGIKVSTSLHSHEQIHPTSVDGLFGNDNAYALNV